MTDEDNLFPQLLKIITKYEGFIEQAEPHFNIDGKKLEEVCRTLPKHIVVYDRFYQEMKSLEEWLMIRREKIQSRLWKKFLEGYSRALSSKDIQMYIQGDPEYVEFTEIIVEVSNIKAKMQSIVKAFEQMGWMLAHVTKLRVAELQDVVL
jgi:hypothetical protein